MKRIVESFKNIFKDKNAKLGVTVLVLLLTIVGATYAYLTLTVNTYNDVYLGNTFCFDINYNIENDNNTLPITGTLWPSALPSGGLSGKVSINISNSCPVLGLGSLFLNVSDTTSSTLVQTVPAHCENSQTLETMKEYTTSEACTAQTNGVWVTNGSALKYAVYNTNDTTSVLPLSVGYINKKGSIGIYENFDVTHTLANYYIYVWLDGELSDNSYAMLSFDGYVFAQVVQSGLISDSGESSDVEVIDNSWTEDFADENIVSQLAINTPASENIYGSCSWGVYISQGVFSSHNCEISNTNLAASASVYQLMQQAMIFFSVPNDGNSYNFSMTTRTPTAILSSNVSSYSVVLYDANDTEFTTPLYSFYEYSTTTFAQLRTGISLGMDALPAGDYTILLTYTANGNYLAYIDDLSLTKVS